MNPRLLGKKFWTYVAASFLFYFLLYSLVSYFIPNDGGESSWSFKQVSNKIAMALLFSIVFGYRGNAQNNAESGEPAVLIKPTTKEFFTSLLRIAIVGVLALTILLLIAWLIISKLSVPDTEFQDTLIRSLIAFVTMCIVIDVCFFVFRSMKFRRQQKQLSDS